MTKTVENRASLGVEETPTPGTKHNVEHIDDGEYIDDVEHIDNGEYIDDGEYRVSQKKRIPKRYNNTSNICFKYG